MTKEETSKLNTEIKTVKTNVASHSKKIDDLTNKFNGLSAGNPATFRDITRKQADDKETGTRSKNLNNQNKPGKTGQKEYQNNKTCILPEQCRDDLFALTNFTATHVNRLINTHSTMLTVHPVKPEERLRKANPGMNTRTDFRGIVIYEAVTQFTETYLTLSDA